MKKDNRRDFRDPFRDLFDNAPLGIYQTTPDGRILNANRALLTMLGYGSLADLQKINLENEGYAADSARSRFKERIEREGTLIGNDAIWVNKIGSHVFVRENARVVRDERGDVLYYEGIVEDITEQKLNEMALQESEERFRLAFEFVRDGLIWVDPTNGKVINCNRYAVVFAGRPKSTIVGRHYTQFVDMDSNEAESCRKVETELRRSGFVETEMNVLAGPMRVRRAGVRASVIRVGSKQIIQGIFRDVTDQRLAETELKRAKTEAEVANKAKTRFLANMSHEMRTPLTAILGFSDILGGSELPREVQQRYLEIIRNNGETLLELINDLLDLARIEAGKLAVELRPTSLRGLIEEATDMVRAEALGKGISMSVYQEPDLPELVMTDATRLRQILLNLLNNAVKFTHRGSIAVSARYQKQTGTDIITISVSDTGIGIDADQLPKLFMPFMQADMSASRSYDGTGLGLAIARHLANRLGGDIKVRSRPGQGSTFSVSIRAQPAEVKAQPAPGARTEVRSGATAAREEVPGLSGRILVAEDTPEIQMFVAAVFATAGLEVVFADDGEAACKQVLAAEAAGKPFDLIFMDIQMPKLDGYAATRQLRGHGWKGPVIAFTARAMESERRQCFDAGCTDCLTKPLLPADLLRVAGSYLRA